MQHILENLTVPALNKVQPLCPVFGECGGCQYQDMTYPQELEKKHAAVVSILKEKIGLAETLIEPIVPSPKTYHYRNRLDLKIMRTKNYGILFGFSHEEKKTMVPITSCPIALPAISDFIPQLKEAAVKKLTAKHRMANVVIRTGEDNNIKWGGIGRRSLRLPKEDYFWTEIEGQRIFYSLETFFQANLSILPEVIKHLKANLPSKEEAVFFDLYGGVGLFGICLSSAFKKVILIEEHGPSVECAEYNSEYNQLKNFELIAGKVEDCLAPAFEAAADQPKVVMVDPPRQGLSPQACQFLSQLRGVSQFVYLSCSPESLARDLKEFLAKGWRVQKVIPFDFFPRTKHIETLVILK